MIEACRGIRGATREVTLLGAEVPVALTARTSTVTGVSGAVEVLYVRACAPRVASGSPGTETA